MTTILIQLPTDPYSRWAREFDDQAAMEGWTIFDAEWSPGKDDTGAVRIECELQIQAICELEDGAAYAWDVDPDFPNCDDAGAWLHVFDRAQEGSTMHQAALDVIEALSPREWAHISAYWKENRT